MAEAAILSGFIPSASEALGPVKNKQQSSHKLLKSSQLLALPLQPFSHTATKIFVDNSQILSGKHLSKLGHLAIKINLLEHEFQILSGLKKEREKRLKR